MNISRTIRSLVFSALASAAAAGAMAAPSAAPLLPKGWSIEYSVASDDFFDPSNSLKRDRTKYMIMRIQYLMFGGLSKSAAELASDASARLGCSKPWQAADGAYDMYCADRRVGGIGGMLAKVMISENNGKICRDELFRGMYAPSGKCYTAAFVTNPVNVDMNRLTIVGHYADYVFKSPDGSITDAEIFVDAEPKDEKYILRTQIDGDSKCGGLERIADRAPGRPAVFRTVCSDAGSLGALSLPPADTGDSEGDVIRKDFLSHGKMASYFVLPDTDDITLVRISTSCGDDSACARQAFSFITGVKALKGARQ